MKLVDFQFEHLALFDWRDEEKKMYNVDSAMMQALLTVEKKGEAYTALHDGRILVIGGIVPLSKKTGYAFTLFSQHADQSPHAAARLVRRMFRGMVEDMGLHRVVTYNLEAALVHHRWCEWLGFSYEGRLLKFDDDGNTYVQYGRVTHGV